MKTTAGQRVILYKIAAQMSESGLPADFVDGLVKVAGDSQGCFELAELWTEAENADDRDAVVADIQELVDEHAEATGSVVEKPKVNFDELDKIIDKILVDKAKLASLIELAGGQSEVSRRTGIPQPSLSRMLSSASMPRRRTLYKIARALDLGEENIATEWVR